MSLFRESVVSTFTGTPGSATITAATDAFTSALVGWNVKVIVAESLGYILSTSIAAVGSSTSLTLADTLPVYSGLTSGVSVQVGLSVIEPGTVSIAQSGDGLFWTLTSDGVTPTAFLTGSTWVGGQLTLPDVGKFRIASVPTTTTMQLVRERGTSLGSARTTRLPYFVG